MSAIFGGSKQSGINKSESASSNRAFEGLLGDFGGILPAAREAVGGLNALLGGDRSGLDSFRKAIGFDSQLERGSRGITANAAASGLLNSGSTARGLQAYGQQLSEQTGQSYLDNLLKKAQLGFNSGQLISGAGQVASASSMGNSSGSSNNGMGAFLGAILSDRRLKKDIVKTGEYSDGLGKYEWTYVWEDNERHEGVMADEVKELRPWALGPEVNGYMTVNYGKLENA